MTNTWLIYDRIKYRESSYSTTFLKNSLILQRQILTGKSLGSNRSHGKFGKNSRFTRFQAITSLVNCIQHRPFPLHRVASYPKQRSLCVVYNFGQCLVGHFYLVQHLVLDWKRCWARELRCLHSDIAWVISNGTNIHCIDYEESHNNWDNRWNTKSGWSAWVFSVL